MKQLTPLERQIEKSLRRLIARNHRELKGVLDNYVALAAATCFQAMIATHAPAKGKTSAGERRLKDGIRSVWRQLVSHTRGKQPLLNNQLAEWRDFLAALIGEDETPAGGKDGAS